MATAPAPTYPVEKSHSTKRWLVIALILVIGLLAAAWVRRPRLPEFVDLASDCRAAMEASPRVEALEAWLAQKKIPVRRRDAPFTKDPGGIADILENAGISAADMQRASFCLYFGNVSVRSEIFGAGHFARGYFVFAADGSLISYKLDSIHLGL